MFQGSASEYSRIHSTVHATLEESLRIEEECPTVTSHKLDWSTPCNAMRDISVAEEIEGD
jgi:hypothetical protein